MDGEIIRLLLDMGMSKENVQAVTRELDGLDAQARKTADATEAAGNKTANLGQTMLQTGRFVQDFAQGGIGGVLNNVEGLTNALGMGSGLAGVLTIAGVAFSLALPKIREWIGALTEGTDAAKHVEAAVKSLTDHQEKLRDQLAAMNAAADVRIRKLKEENAELERQVKLEEAHEKAKTAAAEREARQQQAGAAMAGAPTLREQRQAVPQKARAEELKKLIGGVPEADIIATRVALAIQNEPHFRLKDQASRDAGRDEILGKFYAGDPLALEYVIHALRPAGGTPQGYMPQPGEAPLREQLEQLTPGAQMARRGAQVMETLRGFGRRVGRRTGDEARRRMEAAAKEAAADEGRRRERTAEAFREEGAAAALIPGIGAMQGAHALAGQARRERQRQVLGGIPGRGARNPIDLHELAEAGGYAATGRVQREVLERTGQRISTGQALEMLRARNKQLLEAQQDLGRAILEAAGGQQAQIQQLKAQARAVRQLTQPSTNSGWN